MSYLRGPLTRQQLALLPGAGSAPSAAPGATPAATARTAPTVAAELATILGEEETTVPPKVGTGISVAFVDPAAPWAAEFGAVPGGSRLRPVLAARIRLRFTDTKAAVDHSEEWEAILPLDEEPSVEAATQVDFDERDFRMTPPPGAIYRLPVAPVQTVAFFRGVERDLKANLLRSRSIEIFANRDLKAFSRVGETEEAFLKRCRELASTEADREAAKLRASFESKMDRVRAAIARVEDRVQQVETDAKTRSSHELISGVGDLLGAFLGGKATAGAIATRMGRSARGVSSRRGQTARTKQRLEGAQGELQRRNEELEDIEADLQDDLADLVETWEEKAAAIEPLPITLTRNDVVVEDIKLAWIPTA